MTIRLALFGIPVFTLVITRHEETAVVYCHPEVTDPDELAFGFAPPIEAAHDGA